MTKKCEYEVIAAQYFIEMQLSIAQIARRLNLSEKTLFTWKKAGDWDKKRKFYLKSQYSTNQTLYELLHLITQKAIEDYRLEGTYPPKEALYFIMNMADKLQKLKAYENQTAEEKLEELSAAMKSENGAEAKEDLAAKMLEKTFKAIIGG